MNAPPHPTRTTRLAAAAGLVATAGAALANLPSDPLRPGWLAAFTLPGALLGLAAHLPLRTWQRALLGIALQAATCWLAIVWFGPMTRPAALACTILPPLAFATARGQATDHALALFLSFCVVLVGVILDGVHAPWLAAYLAAGCFALRGAARCEAQSIGRLPRAALGRRVPRALMPATTMAIVGVLLATAAIERLLGALPSPSRAEAPATSGNGGTGGPRRTGLDDSFVLDGTNGGLLSELTGEQLVRVKSNDGDAVPADLYLRSGFFGTPGLDRWQLGRLDLTPPSGQDRHRLRTPRPDLPLHSLMIERYAGAQQFVFVPPGACDIDGIGELQVDPAREWIRQRRRGDDGVYDVTFQRAPLPRDTALDPRAAGLGLLTLPAGLTQRWRDLLAEWRIAGDPTAALTTIANGLAARCRYDRQEPTGPFPHTLDNFLFADGDRRGYCMHFASAAALLLRVHGVPCRIAVGLYGGAPDRRDPRARLYGSQHAHAWVEVPYAGHGYVVFDPTPPAERGRSTPNAARDESDANPDAATEPGARERLRSVLAFLLQPWVLATLLVLAIGASLLPLRGPVATASTIAAQVPKTARRALARLLQTLAAHGLPRTRGQTLESYTRDLARAGAPASIAAAFTAYQDVRFGGHAFDARREAALAAALRDVEQLPLPRPVDATTTA